MARHPELRGSVGQVVEKGFLVDLIKGNEDLGSVIHFEPKTSVLSVEDPQFVFFLRNLGWNEFARHVGYVGLEFESPYDFALSFAGSDREYASSLADLLREAEVELFYDRFEQHRILAEDVEEYLGPIYRSEATYVIAFLGPDYPKRIWTKFESDQFRQRFGDGSVIPVWFTTAPPGLFDETIRVGGVTFDPNGDVDAQLRSIADLLVKRLADDRTRRAIRA